MVLPKAESKRSKETLNRNPKSNVKPPHPTKTELELKIKKQRKNCISLLRNGPETKEGK